MFIQISYTLYKLLLFLELMNIFNNLLVIWVWRTKSISMSTIVLKKLTILYWDQSWTNLGHDQVLSWAHLLPLWVSVFQH